jgi:hypothetical protein
VGVPWKAAGWKTEVSVEVGLDLPMQAGCRSEYLPHFWVNKKALRTSEAMESCL